MPAPAKIDEMFSASGAPLASKLDNFPKYVRRQSLARFLARYELFRTQQPIAGSIVECGVHHGGGLLTWAKLSAALEPYAIHRRIYGFDTFEGFPEVGSQDTPCEANPRAAAGEWAPGYDVYRELELVLEEHDRNRFLAQFKKVFLVKGNAEQTIPAFVRTHPYLVISLLFMDFDLYAPTRTALEHLVPRMGKGAVLAFDEIDNPWWPGETLALLDTLGVATHRLERFPMDPNIAYTVL